MIPPITDNLIAAAPALLELVKHLAGVFKATIGLMPTEEQRKEAAEICLTIDTIVALAEQPDIDEKTGCHWDESYCGECMKPAANCDCGEF